MNGKLTLAIVSLLVFLTGCTKKQFVVDFALDSNVDGNYRMLFYASDSKQGFWMETMAPVEHGKFSYTAPAVNPTLVYILDSSTKRPSAVFYAEKGDKITISGSGNNPLAWKISGNSVSENWTAWRLDNMSRLEKGNPETINRCVKDYVERNPDNRLSPLLLLTMFDRRVAPSEFERLWNNLPAKSRSDKVLRLVASAELTSSSPFKLSDDNSLNLPSGVVKPFRLHSLQNGVDTVNTSLNPTIILFWHSQDNTRHESVAELRRLSHEFPDSASRNIVDISLDADSLTWTGSCTRDSLLKTVRGWIPQGEASKLALQLGVASTPTFVVLAPGGKVRYSGLDIADATDNFRKLIRK